MDNGNQLVTVIITSGGERNGARKLGQAVLELESLVRRMGFEVILRATGESPMERRLCHQVTGMREHALGDDGIAAVNKELRDLKYLHSIPSITVGFGSIADHV